MTAYAIFDVEIHNPDRYKDYMEQVKPALEATGARYLTRGGAHKVNERPRKTLDFDTPANRFNQCVASTG